MNEQLEQTVTSDVAVRRLTALWGLSEAGLGGLIHALRIPFTGIVVGSTAILLITLLAHFSGRNSRTILRATLIVLIIKATVSPHTPAPAYLAVFLQGCMAAVLFRALPGIRLPAMLLGIFAMWEGGLQKFVTMTLVYGQSLWEAIDILGGKAAASLGWEGQFNHASLWVIAFFAVYYGLGGVVIGWLAGILPAKIERMMREFPRNELEEAMRETSAAPVTPRRWAGRRFLPALLLLGIIFGIFFTTGGDAGWSRGWRVLARASLILLLWFALLGPWLKNAIRRLLARTSKRCSEDLHEVLEWLPRLRHLAAWSWARSFGTNRYRRWYQFLKLLIVSSLLYKVPAD